MRSLSFHKFHREHRRQFIHKNMWARTYFKSFIQTHTQQCPVVCGVRIGVFVSQAVVQKWRDKKNVQLLKHSLKRVHKSSSTHICICEQTYKEVSFPQKICKSQKQSEIKRKRYFSIVECTLIISLLSSFFNRRVFAFVETTENS